MWYYISFLFIQQTQLPREQQFQKKESEHRAQLQAAGEVSKLTGYFILMVAIVSIVVSSPDFAVGE